MGQWTPSGADLALIAAIADSGGMTRAARRLGRPKQTLSRQLAQMEAAAGMLLFDRLAPGMQPTAIARLLLPHARRAVAAETEAALALAAFRDRPAGTLRIVAPAMFAQSIVAQAVGRLVAHHPLVDVILRVENFRRGRIDDDIDVALTLGRPLEPDLRIQLVARLSTRLYAPAGLELAPGLGLHELATLPRVSYGTDADQSWELSSGPRVAALDQPAAVIVNEPQACLDILMRMERAIGLLPRFMGQPMVAAGRLQPVLPDWSGRDVRIYLGLRPGRDRLPAVQAFVRELKRAIEACPDREI